MAEMAKGEPHPPADPGKPDRRHHFATRKGPFAIALDRSGKLHFAKPDIGGDPVIVLLGHDVSNAHLAELAGDGVSYVVAQDEEMALAPLLDTLVEEVGVSNLLLEGGGHVHGSFLAEGLVDELRVVLAPAIEGSPNPAIVEAGADAQGKDRSIAVGMRPTRHERDCPALRRYCNDPRRLTSRHLLKNYHS